MEPRELSNMGRAPPDSRSQNHLLWKRTKFLLPINDNVMVEDVNRLPEQREVLAIIFYCRVNRQGNSVREFFVISGLPNVEITIIHASPKHFVHIESPHRLVRRNLRPRPSSLWLKIS